MNNILIKNGRVIDPSQGLDEICDVYIANGVVQEIRKNVKRKATTEIDATGLIITPGLIDIHTHLREPGREDEETIYTGTRAAAAGGFTSVCCMANTRPVCDSRTGIKYILSRALETGVVNVFPVAAITVGQNGEEITEFGDLISAGAVAFSDDGNPVMNAEVMRRTLEYTSMFDVPILDHCEDLNLSNVGVMHEGFIQSLLGLEGVPAAAETIQVGRDIELLEFFGGRLHICHVSASGSIHLLRRAKKRGVRVTCEATPHHLTLTDELVKKTNFDTNTKVKPPLTSEEDRQELIRGLQDGTIDVIATDHAPHTDKDKDMVFMDAPFGLIGLETAVAIIFTELVHKRFITVSQMIEKMSVNPARILKIERGTLKAGAVADVTILDPNRRYTIRADKFFSRSRNTPFDGKKCRGAVDTTIVGGRVIFSKGKILEEKGG
ncbi:MAG: dihydroorotase [Candidatus Sumerlaeota bacterium]|nr:dihydroorotase [Candidatus Sumerlaeota bacterium]